MDPTIPNDIQLIHEPDDLAPQLVVSQHRFGAFANTGVESDFDHDGRRRREHGLPAANIEVLDIAEVDCLQESDQRAPGPGELG
jgi:hypothetical protein